MEAMEELSQLSESIRQAASLLADDGPSDDSTPRRPSTFLNTVILGNIGSGKSAVLNSLSDISLSIPQKSERRPPPLADDKQAAPIRTRWLREVAVAVRPSKKICDASGSISSPSSGSHAWENLLDSLLHQIISLISSFHDFLAFRGTCHSWHAAAFYFPSVYTFSFPPLHLKPDISQESYNSDRKSQLVDPSKKNVSHRCSAPGITPHPMRYLGCSYGYLIFSDRRHCHLVDVYTGTKVKPPKFQSESNTLIYLGILMAPLNSPSLRLILFSRMSMLQWQVGTNFWTEHPLDGELIHQIVFFKGHMFAMDFVQRLHTIRIAPELSTQEVTVMWEESMLVGLHSKPWLVVCGDMLLLVDLSVSMDQLFGFPGTFQVFCLNFSVEPAKRPGTEPAPRSGPVAGSIVAASTGNRLPAISVTRSMVSGCTAAGRQHMCSSAVAAVAGTARSRGYR
ncbi:Dynamin-2A [Hordeum vulgare]|nr:Dynamin-2A [Hordeum vulgare]